MIQEPDLMRGQTHPNRRWSERWKLRVLTIAFSLLFLALAGRLVWVASETEIGWSLLRSQWRDATLGVLAGTNVPLSRQEPPDQAAFWLREAERITAEEPQSAECAMGAALVLDSPATGFMYHHLTMPEFLKSSDLPESVSVGIGPQLAHNGLDCALAKFEDACGPRCLALSARATELEPREVCWWRLRALLQIADSVFGEEQPRAPDWLRVVDQCSNHDPDNALYDYIIASRLWEESTDYSVSGSDMRLEVKDKRKFNYALRHFERGQKKSYCRIGDSWGLAAAEFLGRSGVAPAEQAAIAESRLVPVRVSLLLAHLWRTQYRRAEELKRTGDMSGALTLLRQSLHFLDQFIHPEEPLAAYQSWYQRGTTLTAIQTLAEKHPELVPPRELASIKADARAAILRNKVLVEASCRLKKKQASESFSIFTFVLVGIALSTVPILVVVGTVSWLAGRYLNIGRERPAVVLGPYRHGAAWLVGYGLSFAVLGMAPADIIPRVVQPWIAAALGALAVVAASIWFVWKMVPFLRRRCGIRTWLGMVCGAVFALGLLPILGAVSWDSLHVPVRGWEGGDVDVLHYAMNAQTAASGGRWGWAMMQWCVAQPGAYASVVIAVGLLACWHTLEWARTTGYAGSRLWSRSYWSGLLACLGRSMLIVGFGWLLTYLLLFPNVMQSAEVAYQKKMVYYRHPQEYWETVRTAISGVETDTDWMKKHRWDDQSQ